MNLQAVSPEQELRRLVAPSDWRNPDPAPVYNLVVLGAGSAGLVAAAGAAGLGARVALVEREALGGDCLNSGCVPSKALLRAARAVEEIRRAPLFGIRSGELEVDFGAVMERLRRRRAELAVHDSLERFRSLGVDVFLGNARFAADDRVVVEDRDGGTRELRFRRALVATGGRPVVLPVPGLEEAGYRTNRDLFDLEALPASLVVVGAGPIGCEMAWAFATLGSRVSIVALDPRVLPREDEEASRLVARRLEEAGVRLELGAGLARVERLAGGSRRVFFERGSEAGSVDGEELLLAVGRRPDTVDLDPEAAGIRLERGAVAVDPWLRTTNPRVYAAGDVAGSWQFTHSADAMARLVLRNALFPGRSGRVDRLVMSWCTFTSPGVAHVGLQSGEEAGTEILEERLPLARVDRAVLDEDTEGFVRILYEARSRRLRGATVVHRHAGDLLGEACLAVTEGLPADRLSRVIHPYPTTASTWSRLGDAVLRRRLSPSVARLLRGWLSWQRRF